MVLNNLRDTLWALLGAVLIFLVGMTFLKVGPQWFSSNHQQANIDEACDLRAGACLSTLGSGATISFSLAPDTIPILEPLLLEVKLTALHATQVEIEFSGIDINMGHYRVELTKVSDSHFTGSGMLSFCTYDTMQWQAMVLVYTDEGIVSAPYHFVTKKA